MGSPGARASSQDQLASYRRKRDFTRTQEPSGEAPTPEPPGEAMSTAVDGSRRFVVQRHRARNLHYDFRLEIDGVLVSWAVPKGPTLDPGVRRAAFHVEDHPLEYFDFEGVIPAGEYGGGDVIVWDAGIWEQHPHRKGQEVDPGRAVAEGELHLDMLGEKLRGRFILVRTRTGGAGKDEWLLLHKRDGFAVAGWNPEDHPRSVLSGRTNDDVKADPDRMWRSDQPAGNASVLLKPAPVTADELAALDALPEAGRWQVFGRELRVTSLGKVLFAARPGEDPITKRDLLRYTAQVAPTVLPYLTRRAMDLPKPLPKQAPRWLPRWEAHLVVDEPAALVWAANFGAVQWHARATQIDQPALPTQALIDLDPGDGTDWEDLLALARLYRTAFEHLGLTACAKLTGLGGIEIWIPVASGPSFDETRAWVRQLSKTVVAVVPELAGHTRNGISETAVAPYSPRPAAGAPVSAPIDWDELDDPELTPDRFTISTVPQRLAETGDLFRDVLRYTQRLPRLQ